MPFVWIDFNKVQYMWGCKLSVWLVHQSSRQEVWSWQIRLSPDGQMEPISYNHFRQPCWNWSAEKPADPSLFHLPRLAQCFKVLNLYEAHFLLLVVPVCGWMAFFDSTTMHSIGKKYFQSSLFAPRKLCWRQKLYSHFVALWIASAQMRWSNWYGGGLRACSNEIMNDPFVEELWVVPCSIMRGVRH